MKDDIKQLINLHRDRVIKYTYTYSHQRRLEKNMDKKFDSNYMYYIKGRINEIEYFISHLEKLYNSI